jgi:hypothetical protein
MAENKLDFEQVEQNNLDKFIEKYSDRSERLKDIIELLVDMGYFVCPAAKGHHGNHPGGLFEHSEAVTEILLELTSKLGLQWSSEDSPMVIGLLHDLCKTDQYKFESDGTIIWNNDQLYDGHGEKSLIMALDVIEWLTPEEMACIRYHMGAFTDEKEWKFYSKAVNTFPNVLWTHTADMIASQIKGI